VTKKRKIELAAIWQLLKWTIGFLGSVMLVQSFSFAVKEWLYAPAPRPDTKYIEALTAIIFIGIGVFVQKGKRLDFLLYYVGIVMGFFGLTLLSRLVEFLLGFVIDPIFGMHDHIRMGEKEYILATIGLLLVIAAFSLKHIHFKVQKNRNSKKLTGIKPLAGFRSKD
jgi:hypothetical protein